jgi:asparagine synthase (glutamine-hydrolysing)
MLRSVCGIAGKVAADESVEAALISQMCQVIEHRGPDSHGSFVEENVGLGVQRLAVIDLRTGDQPIFNEDRSVVVVLNGEIYNFEELRSQLRKAGHVFSTRSDTEVIAHLYEEEGADCVRRLRGMFAFAVWDRRLKRLVLARDRIGKKPLYYAVDGKNFWFGSEAKAILQDPAVPRDVNYNAIDAFLQYQHVPGSTCAFAALSKLEPAHVLVLEDGRIDTRRYWALSYETDAAQSVDDAAASIREHLLDATRVRLRSDVPVGAFLSGGVDSSAVVAATAQLVSGRVKTFTIGFPDARVDERRYAREVAQIFDTDHHEYVVEPEMVELLPRMAWHYSEPFSDQSAAPTFYLSELSRQHVTVALNGDGGDENFAGYRRYFGNEVAHRLQRVPASLSRLVTAGLSRLGTGPRQDTARARLLRLSRASQLDSADRYSMWIACFNASDRQAVYTPEARARIDSSRADSMIRDAFRSSSAPTLIERLLDVDIHTYLPDQLLVKVDIASMAHSLEVRSPLLDHHFMEFAARLPLSAKTSRFSTKVLLKDAVAEWIPRSILDRPKQGFTMPISHWLRTQLGGLPAALLLAPVALERALFRREAVERLIIEHQRGIKDHGEKLWALIQLELWFRTYIDKAPSGPIELGITTRELEPAAA